MAKSTRGRATARRKKPRKRQRPAGRLWKRVSLAAAVVILAMGAFWWMNRSFGIWTDTDSAGAPRSSLEVEIFFGNSARDPQSLDCAHVYPVRRTIPATPAVARAAVEALLAGPTAKERREGYFTSLNGNVPIRRLDIRDGTARIDFGRAFETGVAGSCRVEAVRAQVERTLLQFRNVGAVVITVEGREATALQP